MTFFQANVTNKRYIEDSPLLGSSESKLAKTEREATAHLSFVLLGVITVLALAYIGYTTHQLATNAKPLGMTPVACGVILGVSSLLLYDLIAFTARFAAIHNTPKLHKLANLYGDDQIGLRHLVKEAARYTVLVKIPTLFIREAE